MTADDKDDAQRFVGWRYDLEQDPFVAKLLTMGLHVGYGEHSHDQLLRIAPHRAYVLEIEHRIWMLVERFKSLNFVDSLLAFRQFPFFTGYGVLNREQWLRVTQDVMLVRITSIRDCAFMLVASVYQMDLQPQQVSLKALKQRLPQNGVLEVLKQIAASARDIRDDRDRHFHRGEEPALFHPRVALKSAALGEVYGPVGTVILDDGHVTSLEAMHDAAAAQLQQRHHKAGDALFGHARELVAEVEPEFWRQWRTMRDRAEVVWNNEIEQ